MTEHIPYLREALRAYYPAAPLQKRGPLIVSVFILFFFIIIGLTFNSQSTDQNTIFYVCFSLGFGLAASAYVLSKRIFQNNGSQSNRRLILSTYDSIIGRMHGWGFTDAAQSCQSMIENTLDLQAAHPQFFQFSDEIIHTFLTNFSQIGHAKILIGNESELKRQCDRVISAFEAQSNNQAEIKNKTTLRIELAALELRIEKLEDISKCALYLTIELKRIHEICSAVFSKNSVQVDEITEKLSRERFQMSDRLQVEMSKIGL